MVRYCFRVSAQRASASAARRRGGDRSSHSTSHVIRWSVQFQWRPARSSDCRRASTSGWPTTLSRGFPERFSARRPGRPSSQLRLNVLKLLLERLMSCRCGFPQAPEMWWTLQLVSCRSLSCGRRCSRVTFSRGSWLSRRTRLSAGDDGGRTSSEESPQHWIESSDEQVQLVAQGPLVESSAEAGSEELETCGDKH